jgi:hypothetical protein
MDKLEGARGEYLRTWGWTYWATLTFVLPPTPRTAKAEVSRWLRRLGGRAGGKIYSVGIVEAGPLRLRNHAHLLLLSSALSRKDVEATWGAGWVNVRRYDGRRGACNYLAEKVARGGSYDLIFDPPSQLTLG